jgi:hypothetical protein
MADSDYDGLASEVRLAIADLPERWCNPSQIDFSLKKARSYISLIKRDDVTDELTISQCIVALTVYWTYVNYLANASNRDGTIPEAAPALIASYKETAIAFLTMISRYPLGNDLIPDVFTKEESEQLIPGNASLAMYSILS